MGGFGSGRRKQVLSRKPTTDLDQIDVRQWYREGWLKPGRSFLCKWGREGKVQASVYVKTEADRIIFCHWQRAQMGVWRAEDSPVSIVWTACGFGGCRPWFACPASGCGRRVAILYAGKEIACRRCHHLAYPSQRERADDRALRRAEGLRHRLGWEPGILNPQGGKPKGMHWRTFMRIREEEARWMRLSLEGKMRILARIQRYVECLGGCRGRS